MVFEENPWKILHNAQKKFAFIKFDSI